MNDLGEKGVSLLLVEDDDVDALGVRRGLKQQGLDIPFYRAKDGIQALELLRSRRVVKPLLIVLDLNMPRMGGLEFLQELRADEKLRDIGVFVYTTSVNEEEIQASYQLNVSGYIVKTALNQNFKKLLKFLREYIHINELPA